MLDPEHPEEPRTKMSCSNAVESSTSTEKTVACEGVQVCSSKEYCSPVKCGNKRLYQLSQNLSLLSRGISDFAKIRYNREYVDKTLLIQKVMEAPSYILLVAPRLFGKTTNLSMLKYFLEICYNPQDLPASRRLFRGLKIEKCKFMDYHLGKYPIIYLSFRSPGCLTSFNDAFVRIRNIVQEAYRSHDYLVYSDALYDLEKDKVEDWRDNKMVAENAEDIFVALKKLAEYLAKHFKKKIFVMVDEYDDICSNALFSVTNQMEFENIRGLCMGSVMCLLKDNEHVERAVLTGISHLMASGSELHHIQQYKFHEIHQFSQFYGLTRDELRSLSERFSDEDLFSNVVEYYGGYRNDMLNIWSVMHYLGTGKMVNWWSTSGVARHLHPLFGVTLIRDYVSRLLCGRYNEVEITNFRRSNVDHIILLKNMINQPEFSGQDVHIFLNFLLESGYLVTVQETAQEVVLRVPNQEIRDQLRELLIVHHQKVRT